MRRSKIWALTALVLSVLFIAPHAVPSWGTALTVCRLALSEEASVPDHQIVRPGDAIRATYAARAVAGDWAVRTSVAAEHGRIQGRAIDVDLSEGDQREVVVRFEIGDVPDGTYSIGIFVSARCRSADASARTTYSFQVTVARGQAGHLSDPPGDHVLKANGQSVASVDAVDLIQAEAMLDEDVARFRLSFADPLPEFGANAPLRVGCYLDTFGTATLLEPFDPRGFERRALVSWHADETSPRIEDLRGNPAANPLDVTLSDARDGLTMTIGDLDVDDAPAWLCFAETATDSGAVLDIVPNHGGPYRGWINAD